MTRRRVLRAAVLTLGLAGRSDRRRRPRPGSRASRSPLTYISFGFFQPLFLAALAGGHRPPRHAPSASRAAQLARRELPSGASLFVAAALARPPLRRPSSLGLRGRGRLRRRQDAARPRGDGGYVSYPKNWLKGIFEARPLLADGLGAARCGSSRPRFFLSRSPSSLWAARALRGTRAGRPRRARRLGRRHALPRPLAEAERLLRGAALPRSALVEAARLAAAAGPATAPRAARPPRAAGRGAVGLVLALPMVAGHPRRARERCASPGSDLFETLELDARAASPRGRRLRPAAARPAGPPGALARAASVLAPWSLGHLILYEAELPVVANNFGYGFLDSIRFFLARIRGGGARDRAAPPRAVGRSRRTSSRG